MSSRNLTGTPCPAGIACRGSPTDRPPMAFANPYVPRRVPWLHREGPLTPDQDEGITSSQKSRTQINWTRWSRPRAGTSGGLRREGDLFIVDMIVLGHCARRTSCRALNPDEHEVPPYIVIRDGTHCGKLSPAGPGTQLSEHSNIRTHEPPFPDTISAPGKWRNEDGLPPVRRRDPRGKSLGIRRGDPGNPVGRWSGRADLRRRW